MNGEKLFENARNTRQNCIMHSFIHLFLRVFCLETPHFLNLIAKIILDEAIDNWIVFVVMTFDASDGVTYLITIDGGGNRLETSSSFGFILKSKVQRKAYSSSSPSFFLPRYWHWPVLQRPPCVVSKKATRMKRRPFFWCSPINECGMNVWCAGIYVHTRGVCVCIYPSYRLLQCLLQNRSRQYHSVLYKVLRNNILKITWLLFCFPLSGKVALRALDNVFKPRGKVYIGNFC